MARRYPCYICGKRHDPWTNHSIWEIKKASAVKNRRNPPKNPSYYGWKGYEAEVSRGPQPRRRKKKKSERYIHF